MFEPYMKSFYVRSTDPTHIKTLKVSPMGPSQLGKKMSGMKIDGNNQNGEG